MNLPIFPLNYTTNGMKTELKGYLNPDLKQKVKFCGELKYSKTYNSWCYPCCKGLYQNLNEQFTNIKVLNDCDSLRTAKELHPNGIAYNYLPVDPPDLPHPLEENVLIEANDKESSQRVRLEKIFEKAKDGAKVIKNLTLHSLRHSFAMHLHQQGTD